MKQGTRVAFHICIRPAVGVYVYRRSSWEKCSASSEASNTASVESHGSIRTTQPVQERGEATIRIYYEVRDRWHDAKAISERGGVGEIPAVQMLRLAALKGKITFDMNAKRRIALDLQGGSTQQGVKQVLLPNSHLKFHLFETASAECCNTHG